MSIEYKDGDRVIVTTTKVNGVKGTLSGRRNGEFYLGKLDDGRSFQATADCMTKLISDEKQAASDDCHYSEALDALTPAQIRLVQVVAMQGKIATDELARAIQASTVEAASMLLRLTRQGFLGYAAAKSPRGYAEWHLSSSYREYLRRKHTLKPEPVETPKHPRPAGPVKVEEYILWSPGSNLPPSVVYPTMAEARRVAEIMARKHPGQEFKICGIVGSAQLKTEKVVTEKQTLIIK